MDPSNPRHASRGLFPALSHNEVILRRALNSGRGTETGTSNWDRGVLRDVRAPELLPRPGRGAAAGRSGVPRSLARRTRYSWIPNTSARCARRTRSLARLLACSLARSLARSLACSLTPSLAHSRASSIPITVVVPRVDSSESVDFNQAEGACRPVSGAAVSRRP